LAHLKTHLDFVLSPVGGRNALVGPKVVAPIMEHCAQHLVYFYLQKMMETGRDVAQQTGLPADETLAAATSEIAQEAIMKDIQPLLESFGKAMQMAQQYAPKPPQDPRAMALLEAAKMETARKAEADKANAAQRQAEGQAKAQAQSEQQAAANQLKQWQQDSSDRIESMRLMLEQQREADRSAREAEAQSRNAEIELLKAQLQSTTETLKNAQDNEAHTLSELLKNHEDNVTKLMLALASSKGGDGEEGQPTGEVSSIGELTQQLLASHQAKLDQLVNERAQAGIAEAANAESAQMRTLLGQITSILSGMQEHNDRRSELEKSMLSGLSSIMKTVKAPRKLVYDAAGNPVSSVPELEDESEVE